MTTNADDCSCPGVWRYRGRGCRCRGCVTAWMAFRAERKKYSAESRGWVSCDAPSRSRYENEGCRCDECRRICAQYRSARLSGANAGGKRPNGRDPLPAYELEYLRRMVGYTPKGAE